MSSLTAGFSRRSVGNAARFCAAISLCFGTMNAALADTPKAGEKAPDFELTSLDQKRVRLSTLTEKGPVVLVVLRGYPGYQCPICTAQFGSLRGKADKFADAKAQVLLVYPGPAEDLKKRAEEFVGNKTMPKNFQMLLDPNYEFTTKYALRWNAKNETAYPSTFVIDAKGVVRFAKVSHSHGDRAKTEEILETLGKI